MRFKLTEKLGYREEDRLLIVNIDDYGMCNAINTAAEEILAKGNASSCTIMMPCAWSLNGIRRLSKHRGLEIGVHLTVISEQPYYRWGPLNCPKDVSSLIDRSDRFFYSQSEMKSYTENALLNEVEAEFRKQIDEAFSSGVKPTHLDSHCHAHELRDDIFSMTLTLGREYRLPVRIKDRRLRRKAEDEGMPVINYDTLDSYCLPVKERAKTYTHLLETLPSGVSEWAIHPGKECEELIDMEPETWECRTKDYEFFVSDNLKKVLDEENIHLISYKKIGETYFNTEV